MQFRLQNVYRNDNRPRVLVMPTENSAGTVAVYRLDDETVEWSHWAPIDTAEKMDDTIEMNTVLITNCWHTHHADYTIDSLSSAATA